MKASNYSFFFTYEADADKMIAYNSFSSTLALMDKKQYEIFNNFVQNDIAIDDEIY